VPSGISLPDQPEISTTQWRSVSDQTERVYYFKLTDSPATVWIDLNEFDLYAGAPILKLDLIGSNKVLVGNVIKDMKQSKGFSPMYQMTAEIAQRFK
jgi:choloylglycine hydrolase